jgi:hypothetical protein
VLLEAGADVNAKESWGGTTALMWAVSRRARRRREAAARGRGRRQRALELRGGRQRPRVRGAHAGGQRADPKSEEFASGWLTPLMLAAREGEPELARVLVDAGADVNAVAGDGKTALALSIFQRQLRRRVAVWWTARRTSTGPTRSGSLPLFWAVDRRNMETAPNFPLDGDGEPAAAHPQAARCRRQSQRARQQHAARPMREGSPRIVFATALMRAAFAPTSSW